MRLSPLTNRNCLLILISSVAALASLPCAAQNESDAEYRKESNEALSMWQVHLREANNPHEKQRLAGEVYEAAIRADHPDVAEQAVAGGPLRLRQISLSRGNRHSTPLKVIRVFDEIESKLEDEYRDAPNEGVNWLARRITRDALEVWTPAHGWLFDGKGHLLNEVHPAQHGSDTGREWHGAFLPDGSWVTTDANGIDNSLVFFSRDGQFIKSLSCDELALRSSTWERNIFLGWARSNKEGTAWIVNVGSEEGYATVSIGPEGAPRQLFGTERWQACFPRALGARGWYKEMWSPDDTYRVLLERSEAGHGQNVGYPGYSVLIPDPTARPETLGDERSDDRETDSGLDRSPLGKFLSVPDGNYLFGFWPGSREIFIGTFRPLRGLRRSYNFDNFSKPRDGNSTWFFGAQGEFRGWFWGRRIADSSDGRGMLFRLEDSKDVVTLLPSLRMTQKKRFVWDGGKTAVALSLFDDLHLGLFRKEDKLALAEWQ